MFSLLYAVGIAVVSAPLVHQMYFVQKVHHCCHCFSVVSHSTEIKKNVLVKFSAAVDWDVSMALVPSAALNWH